MIRLWIVLLFLWTMVMPSGAEPVVPRSRYLLFQNPPPESEEAWSPTDILFEKAGIARDSDLGRLLSSKQITKWKTFEDKYVRFDYPDFPGFEVATGEQRPAPGTQIYGGVVGTVSRQSSRFYSVHAGKATWAVIMLQEETEFDEGFCLCGQVALRVYVPAGGCLRAYDLLANGDLKKLQVLGEGARVQVFEWTHLPMSQENYLRLTESLVLKQATAKSDADWLKEFRAGHGSLFGWLRPGMREAEVVALLGKPTLKKGTDLLYRQTDPDKTATWTYRIPVPGGVFPKLPEDWSTVKELPPVRGTVRWVQKVRETGKFAKADLPLLNQICEANLKHCQGEEWNGWVQTSSFVTSSDWRKSKLGPLIAARFLDEDVGLNHASLIIGDLLPKQAPELFAKRLRMILAKKATLEDDHNLMVMCKDKATRAEFVTGAIVHQDAAIRERGYRWINVYPDLLPAEEQLSAARKGLDDALVAIRRDSAEIFTRVAGTLADLELLAARAAKETDSSVIDKLTPAIRKSETREDLPPSAAQEVVAKRLRTVLAAVGEDKAPAIGGLAEAPRGEYSRLMSRLADKAGRVDFVRQGIAHSHHVLRREAYGWINTLPLAEQRKAAENGLDDSEPAIRRVAATAFTESVGTKADLGLLQAHLAKEKDSAVAEELRTAIRVLQAP